MSRRLRFLAFRAQAGNFYHLGLNFKSSAFGSLRQNIIELFGAALCSGAAGSANEEKVIVAIAGKGAANIGIEGCYAMDQALFEKKFYRAIHCWGFDSLTGVCI